MTQKYHSGEHKSELFSLRADLLRKIDDFQKKKPHKITWRGVPYLEILKLEKTEVENSLKNQIREEVEAKRMKRGGTVTSTYNRLMV